MNQKYKLSSEVKWIVFGGSYPGSLAAWMRVKYPFLVHGAMSASGPLLAEVDFGGNSTTHFNTQVTSQTISFSDYYKVVDASLATHSDECVLAIKQATDEVNTLLKHMVGQRNLNKLFRLCDPVEKSINSPNDIANLFESLAGNFAGVVQYNKDNRIGKSAKLKNVTIDTVCDIMVNQTIGPPVTRLAAVNGLILDTYEQKCLDFKYDNMVNELRNISWKSETAEGGCALNFPIVFRFLVGNYYFRSPVDLSDLHGVRVLSNVFLQPSSVWRQISC